MPEKRTTKADGENDDGARKRQRQTTEQAEPELFSRAAAPDTILEIDIMILDYLAYRTTKCLLETPYNSSHDGLKTLQRHLDLVESWIVDFNARHSSWRKDDDLCHRLTLLSFSTLYFRRLDVGRHTPDRHVLQNLRAENNERAEAWIEDLERLPSAKYVACGDLFEEALPLNEAILQAHRQRVLTSMKVPHRQPDDPSAQFYGSPDSLSLLDIIPAFMRICASVVTRVNGKMEPSIVRVLCDLMRQACLEQYLVYGAKGCDPIDQGLAWGCYSERPERQASEWEVDSMFRESKDSTELELWTTSKEALLKELMGDVDKDDSLQQKLEKLADRYPMVELNSDVWSCVRDLCAVIEPPILAQLEQGRLKNLNPTATREFLQDCGISPAFFSSIGQQH